MKMKVILIAIMFILQFPELTYSQATVWYEDNTVLNSWINDMVVDNDGSIIYVGNYWCPEGDHRYGLIAKISPEGERVCDYITPDNPDRSLRFTSVSMTDRGTFIVTGGEESEGDCGISIMEFDSNLELLWYRYHHVTDIYSAILRNVVIPIGGGEYIGTFMDVYNDGSLDGNNYMFKFNELGDLLKIEYDTISPISFRTPSDIVPLGDGELFMIVGADVFFIVDKDLSVVSVVPEESQPADLPDGLNDASFSVTVGCKRLSDGRLFCSSAHHHSHSDIQVVEGLMFMELDEDYTPSNRLKVLNSRSIVNEPYSSSYRSYPAEKNPIDFVTEDNIIIGGILNCYNVIGVSFRPYMTQPALLCVASFDPDRNINWEQYYEDEHAYYMMVLRATSDGGAVVGTIKTKQGSLYGEDIGTVAILKFDSPVGVRDVYSDNLFSVYPNPATNILTINVEIGDCDVHFYDTMGRLCRSVVVDGVTQNVDISDMVKGLYLVNAIVDGKIISNQKLMIR